MNGGEIHNSNSNYKEQGLGSSHININSSNDKTELRFPSVSISSTTRNATRNNIS